MPAPIVAFGVAKAVTWIVGILAASWATNKITKTFGSTPANDLAKVQGMENAVKPQQIYNDAKRHKKDRINYHKDREKASRTELDKINKQIEELKEEKQNLAKDLKAEKDKDNPNPQKIAAISAKIDGINDKLSSLEAKASEKKEDIKEGAKAIDEIYESLGDPNSMTEQQYVAKANSINWTSWKNYGIIFICIVVVIMIIGFLKKLLAGFASSLK